VLRRGVGRVGRHDSMLIYYILCTAVERGNVGISLIVARLRRLKSIFFIIRWGQGAVRKPRGCTYLPAALS